MSSKRLLSSLVNPVGWYRKRQLRYQERKNSLECIKVYSFPRSGTHFLEAFIGRNFYPEQDLRVTNVSWGHWSSIQLDRTGNEFGMLFGSHNMPKLKKHKLGQPCVYIYRDPRAVAYSIWRTPYFLNKNIDGITFDDLIDLKLDWCDSPRRKIEPVKTLAEHWYDHVDSWLSLRSDRVLCIRYEDLVSQPEDVYRQIAARFFPALEGNLCPLDPVTDAVGLRPNEAVPESWRNVFTPELESRFLNYMPSQKYIN